MFVLTEKNYFALSETLITYQKANDTVHDFIADEDENFKLLKNALVEILADKIFLFNIFS